MRFPHHLNFWGALFKHHIFVLLSPSGNDAAAGALGLEGGEGSHHVFGGLAKRVLCCAVTNLRAIDILVASDRSALQVLYSVFIEIPIKNNIRGWSGNMLQV